MVELKRRRRFVFPATVIAGVLLLAGCGSDAKSTDNATTTGGDRYGSSSTEATTAPEAPSTQGTVEVAEAAGLGKILVDGRGFTLYLFEADQGTTSACTGGCAAIWPALTSSSAPTAGTGADATLLETADGQVPNQVVYNGRFLYTFSGDTEPGDAKGTAIPTWFAVGPDGEKVVKS